MACTVVLLFSISSKVLQVLVIDYKLAFPAGTATALMINSLHGEKEAELTGYGKSFNRTVDNKNLFCTG